MFSAPHGPIYPLVIKHATFLNEIEVSMGKTWENRGHFIIHDFHGVFNMF